MAYKQKGFAAHDNMKTKSKDLSGRASVNQRTPQVKPGDAPAKISVEDAWNTGSNVSSAMSGQAGAASSNIHKMQQTSGFVNNPNLADYNKNANSTPKATFSAKETGMGPRAASAGGVTKDASEVAAKSRGSIQDMINQTISNVQTTQDAKRAAALNKYKSELAAKRAATKSAYDSSIASWRGKLSASEGKNASMSAAHQKMLAAQKAAAAKAAAARRRRSSGRNPVTKVLGGVGKVVGGVGKTVGKVVKGVTKTVGKVAKGVRRFVRRIFGGRRRRRRRGKKPASKKPVTVAGFGTTTKKPAAKKPAAKKPVAKKRRKRRRRRRRRWFSDVRLKHNVKLMGSSPAGIPIYNFSYIGDNTIYQGTMAQDLLAMGYNSAITTDNTSGYYMVDYNQIDIDMIKI